MSGPASRLLGSIDSPIGVIADRFELLAEAGAGGMGTVYRARDRESGELVALKVMNAVGDVERFVREAKALSELEDPAIVRYVAHGTTEEGEPYLAMEWLEGRTLRDALSDGPLAIPDVLAAGARIARGLAAAHAKEIIHRDLKPSNVFLDGGRFEDARILDFGVARLRDLERELTLSGQVIGTPGYMAPEQARGLRDLDGRADLFSLGCVLFRCIAGRPAFEGDDVLSVLAELVLHDPPSVASLVPGVPRALDALVGVLLEKDPNDRPASALDVARDLDEIARSVAEGRAEIGGAESGGSRRKVFLVVGGAEPGAPPPSEEELSSARDRIRRMGGTFQKIAGGVLVATIEETGPLSRRKAAELEAIVRAVVPKGHVALSHAVEKADAADAATAVQPPVTRKSRRVWWAAAAVAVPALAIALAAGSKMGTKPPPSPSAPAAVVVSCTDDRMNGAESDVDCGGPDCPVCVVGKRCAKDGDCIGGRCAGDPPTCRESCDDGVRSQDETDVDCGGEECAPCGVGEGCRSGEDCETGACNAGACVCARRDGVLLISEVVTRGVDGGSDEFVELFNPGKTPVTLSPDWVLEFCSETGTEYSPRFVGGGQTVGPGRHFLVVGSAFKGVAPDAVLPTGISDDGSLVLRNAAGVVDAVCFGCGANKLTTQICEGSIAAKIACNANADKSIERKPGGAKGNCVDSDDNATDFVETSPSTPQGLAAPAPP